MMVWVRDVGCTRLPDATDDPAKGGEDHINHSADHKNLKGAVPVAESAEENAKNAIADAKNDPGNQAGSQKPARSSHKAKNGNPGQKSQNGSRRDIAFESKTLKERHAVSDDQPSHENKGEANADVDARADRGIAKEVKPTIAGQM